MRKILLMGVVIGAVFDVTGIDVIEDSRAVDEPPSSSKQLTLMCPEDWSEFCGGWTVADMTIEGGGLPEQHMQQGDRFVIGASADGRLRMLPRDALKAKWGNIIGLEAVTVDGKCLSGRVQLGHDGAQKWHRVTFTAGLAVADGDVGAERVLNIMTRDELDGSDASLDSCYELNLHADLGMRAAHAGMGHAED